MKDHRHGHGHRHHEHADGDGPRDHLGNPEDLTHYLGRLEDPERAAWQQPDVVVSKLGLRDGDRVCEVGPGPGYFTLRVARAVGANGKVFAIEAEPRMIEILRTRLADAHLANVKIVTATDGATVPPEPVDRVLIVNTFHHFPNGVAYLRALADRLASGGTLVNIDFHGGELPVGPPPDHKVSREDFLAAAASAGLVLVREERFLPYQYFLVLAPR